MNKQIYKYIKKYFINLIKNKKMVDKIKFLQIKLVRLEIDFIINILKTKKINFF